MCDICVLILFCAQNPEAEGQEELHQRRRQAATRTPGIYTSMSTHIYIVSTLASRLKRPADGLLCHAGQCMLY